MHPNVECVKEEDFRLYLTENLILWFRYVLVSYRQQANMRKITDI